MRRLFPLVAVTVALVAAPAYAVFISSTSTSASWTAATLSAPTNVTVTWACDAGTLNATVDWTTVDHADRYDVWWTTDPTAGWHLAATAAAPPVTHATTAGPNTRVHHRVVARTGADWVSPNTDVANDTGPCGSGGGGRNPGGGNGNRP